MARLGTSSERRCRLPFLTRWISVLIVLATAVLSRTAASQNRPSKQARTGTEILFLGTGGGPGLHEDRSEPSTVLIVDGRQYLIDCGIGTMQRMLQAGIQSEQIKTIFLTHLHPDHDLGLADVLGNDFFRLTTATSGQMIHIYGPPQTKELIDAAFHYITVPFSIFAAESLGPGPPKEIKNPFMAHEVEHDGLVYQDDRIRVTAAENTHYALMPGALRQRMKSYSYRMETPHGTIVFTGDTGPSDAVVRLSKGADVLVTEVEDLVEVEKFVNGLAKRNDWPAQRTASLMAHMKQEHLDLKAAGKLAASTGVKSVILYHYNPADPPAYVSGVKKYFSGAVVAPADLDRYCLIANSGGRSPAGVEVRLCNEQR